MSIRYSGVPTQHEGRRKKVHPYVTRWDEWPYEQGFEIEQLQKQQIAVGGVKARGSQGEAEARVAASEGRDQFPQEFPFPNSMTASGRPTAIVGTQR